MYSNDTESTNYKNFTTINLSKFDYCNSSKIACKINSPSSIVSSITYDKIQASLMLKHPAPPKPRIFDFYSDDEDTEISPPLLLLSHPAPPFPSDAPEDLNSDSESEEALPDDENVQCNNPLHESVAKTKLQMLVSKSKVVCRMRKSF